MKLPTRVGIELTYSLLRLIVHIRKLLIQKGFLRFGYQLHSAISVGELWGVNS